MKFFRFKKHRKVNSTPEGDQTTSLALQASPLYTETPPDSRQLLALKEYRQLQSKQRSVSRTRREIADIVLCNDFDKFATFTFDPKKHPKANDLNYAKSKMIKWLGNQQALYGSFRYLMVYEYQKNGNLHFHALLGGFTGKYHRTNMRGNAEQKRQCYKVDSWENSYGFADMEDISDKQRIALYIGKYITKDIDSTLHVKGSKRYFSSKGLRRPPKTYGQTIEEIMYTGEYASTPVDKYENDYVEVTTYAKMW